MNYKLHAIEVRQTVEFESWLEKVADWRGPLFIILLCGGDKSSQAQDIRRAIAMAGEV